MKVILNHKHPLGRSFLAELPDGKFNAGFTEKSAKHFSSAREAYDDFLPLAAEGDHGAWNICYHLEDYIPDLQYKDDSAT